MYNFRWQLADISGYSCYATKFKILAIKDGEQFVMYVDDFDLAEHIVIAHNEYLDN